MQNADSGAGQQVATAFTSPPEIYNSARYRYHRSAPFTDWGSRVITSLPATKLSGVLRLIALRKGRGRSAHSRLSVSARSGLTMDAR